MRRLLFAVILILSVSARPSECFSQFKPDDKLPNDPAVKIGKLPNGLTYYIRKNTKPEKKAQLRLVVNTGSVLEDKDQLGLAHFMEHMNFNGSKNFPKNDLVSYLQSIGVKFGADLNASTSFDETIYILPIPTDDPEKVEKGFTVLEDWAGNALLDPAEIDKERGVVLEESRLGKGASERMGKVYLPKLFNGSAYADRLPIGKDSILSSFKPEVLKRFYRDWYRPDLMAVIVVGDIEPAEAEKKIIAHFSKFKNPATPRKRPAIIPIPERKTSEAIVLTDKEQPQTVLQILHSFQKLEPVKTWKDYRKNVIEALISSMMNERLSELAQSKEPPFVFGGASSVNFLRGYKAAASFALVGNKSPDTALNALISTTESIQKYGFLQSELDRAKSNLLTQMERAKNDKDKTESARFVQDYISHYLNGTQITGIDDRYAFLQQTLPAVTIDEVNKIAAGKPGPDGQFVLLMGPESAKSKLPDNKQFLSMVNAAKQLPVKPYAEKNIAGALMDKTPAPGKIVSETSNAKLGTTSMTLSNGITITVKSTDFKNDEILMDGWRKGGYYNFDSGEKINAENAASFVNEMGVKDLSPVDLNKFLAGKTVTVFPYINASEEGIEGTSSVKDLETFFQLIHLYFTRPRRDEQLFNTAVSNQKAILQNQMVDPFAYFNDTLTRIRYGNHPWAPVMDKPSDYDKISLDKVLGVYNQIFGNAYGMHFTFTGNVDLKTFKPLVETYLASLPSSPKENKSADVGLRQVKGVVNADIKRGEDKKSLVSIQFSGESPYSKEESIKLQALAEVITLRLIEQLREEMGGIYGGSTRGALSKRPYQHYTVTTSFPCGPENVDKLTKAVFRIYDDLRKNGCDIKELDKVKETWKNQYREQLKQNGYWLNILSSSWIDEENPEFYLEFAENVNRISCDDVKAAANKYLDMNNYVKAVLYPSK